MLNPIYRQMPADLGLEPPLTADGAVAETMMRRRLSPRWMAGLVLISLAGTVLMLFSVVAALSPVETRVTSPQITKPLSVSYAKKAGCTVLEKRDQGTYEKL